MLRIEMPVARFWLGHARISKSFSKELCWWKASSFLSLTLGRVYEIGCQWKNAIRKMCIEHWLVSHRDSMLQLENVRGLWKKEESWKKRLMDISRKHSLSDPSPLTLRRRNKHPILAFSISQHLNTGLIILNSKKHIMWHLVLSIL